MKKTNKVENFSTLNKMCPSCGANIVWDIEKNSFYCKYCNSTFNIDEVDKNVSKSKSKCSKSNFNKVKKEDNLSIFSCGSCGAEIICDNTVTATKCVFCGNNVVLSKRIESGILPDYIIPFSKTKDYIYKEFKRIGKGKVLVSNKFKNLNNITEINGIYVPFWAYDFKMDGSLTIVGDETSHHSDSEYDYTETTTYESVVDCHFDFSKILCDASKKIPDVITSALEPYDLTNLVEYKHSYLSGFLAENYDVSLDECFDKAKNRALSTAVSCASAATYHSFCRCRENNLNIVNTKNYYLMLPVWMISIDYNNKRYIFAVNGDTGELVGDYPISILRVIIFSLLIFVLIFGITYLLIILFNNLVGGLL